MSLVTVKDILVAGIGDEIRIGVNFWTKELRLEPLDAIDLAHRIEAVAKELLKEKDPRPYKGGHKS